MARIAVIYDSHGGRTADLAQALAEGAGAGAVLARVPPLPGLAGDLGPGGAEHAHPVAAPDMLEAADGIALGCPVHLGAPSAAMLAFLTRTGVLWMGRGLAGRPATIFAAAGSGGGAEPALATLWSVLASHGMILVPGAPEAAQGPGGAPMGTVMAAGQEDAARARGRAQGARLAHVAAALMAAGRSGGTA